MKASPAPVTRATNTCGGVAVMTPPSRCPSAQIRPPSVTRTLAAPRFSSASAACGAVAALFWFTAPDSWKSRLGLSAGGASPLALVTTHMDRQRLESGNELLTVTGRVINPTGSEQPVPPIQAQLKSATGKVVYSWSIAPPAQSLPPGASASFNSAEVNVPPGGEEITLTLGTPKA